MTIEINHPASQITQSTGSGLTQATSTSSRTSLKDIKLVRNVEITYAELTSQCADLLNIWSLCYNNDGTILYLVEGSTSTASNDARKTVRIHYTTLSTAYDVSTKDTWSYLDVVLNTAPSTIYNIGMANMQFGDSGNYLYIYGIYRYASAPDGTNWARWYPYIERHTLSTPYDITTASYDSNFTIYSYYSSTTTDTSFSYSPPTFSVNADYLTFISGYTAFYSVPTPSAWALPTSVTGLQSMNFANNAMGYTPYDVWYENSGTEALVYASHRSSQGRAYAFPTTLGRFTLPTTNRVTSVGTYNQSNSNIADFVHSNSYYQQEAVSSSSDSSYSAPLEGVDELLYPRDRAFRPPNDATDKSTYGVSFSRYACWSGNMVPHGDTYANGVSRLNLYTPAISFNANVGQELSIDQYAFGIGTLKTEGVEELKTYSKKYQVNAPVVVIGGSSFNNETDESLRALQFQKIFIGTASEYNSATYLAPRIYIGYKFYSSTPDSKVYIGEPNGYTLMGGYTYIGGRSQSLGSNPTVYISSANTSTSYGYFTVVASTVSNPTGTSSPYISMSGAATNVDFWLRPKGSGYMMFGNYSSGSFTPAGYIYIKDNNGTLRRLLVG